MKYTNIILIGMMGSGKSTIGRILANEFNLDFIDLDSELEKFFQKSISEIFLELGESAFREVETKLLSSFSSKFILSTGGGVVLSEKNREILKDLGFIIWLKASPEHIFKRVKTDRNRPLLTGNEEEKLLKIQKLNEERYKFYSELADLEIITDDLSPSEIIHILLSSTPKF